MTSVVLPAAGGTVSFVYDPFGRRIQKVKVANTIYVYDGADILQEVTSTGAVSVVYTMGPGIDQPLAQRRGTTNAFYETDGLGSVTSLTDSTKAIARTYTYDSYGRQTGSGGTVVNNFRFTAREVDPETGLMYYRARYYDQNVGRFLNEDPIEFKGGINFYAYVKNRPTKYKDSSGLLRDCDEEHIECNRKCQSSPVGCLPWPVGRHGSPAVRRWSRTAYCTAKCLEEYMACDTANATSRVAEFCSSNPLGCAALIAAGAIIAAQPELAPVLAPAF